MKHSITERQSRLLLFIKSYMATSGGIAPSFSEMCQGIGLSSKSAVHGLLRGLQERGHISQIKNRARSVTLIEEEKE